MPKKEPLTREKTERGWRPTGDVELTDRAKTKLRAQISRAERIIRVEKPYSKGWHAAQRMRTRAKGLLKDKPSPGKKQPRKKSMVPDPLRKVLETIGKVGQKKGEG